MNPKPKRSYPTKPSHKPTPENREKVETFAAYGVPEHAIAKVLKIAPKTLRKHFRDELDTGHIKANATVAGSLYKKCLGDGGQSVTACIFWLKTRAGWKESAQIIEHTGAEGGPIELSDAKSRLALLLGRKPVAGTDKPDS